MTFLGAWKNLMPMGTALVLSAACGNDGTFDDRPERDGELGTGTFRYICVGDADPFCEAGFVAETFPERFAVGGRFDLEFDPDDSWIGADGPLPQVSPAAPGSVATEAMSFSFVRAGFAAFLARDAVAVIDLRHFYGSPVERIAVQAGDSMELGEIVFEAGQELNLAALPQDEFRTTLAGSLDYVWTIDDETIAEVASVDMDRDITIRGVGAGETVLRIQAGGFERELTLTVDDTGAGTDSTTSDATTSGTTTGDGTGSSGDATGSTGDGTGTTGDATGTGTTGGTN